MNYAVENPNPLFLNVKMEAKAGFEQWFLLCSDIHFDSQECDRKLLEKHFNQAKEREAGIIIAGDLFDAMQGRNDKRRAHGAKRAELLTGAYFNGLVDEVGAFLKPYADNLLLISEGNHETAPKKYNDVDLMQFLRYKLEKERGEASQTYFGQYEGVVRFSFKVYTKGQSINLYYHHGASGASPVTRGVIEFARVAEYWPDADIVLMGHNHQRNMQYRPVNRITPQGNLNTRERLFLRSGTYKGEEKGSGWATEKNMGVPALGGWWLRFFYEGDEIKVEPIPTT